MKHKTKDELDVLRRPGKLEVILSGGGCWETGKWCHCALDRRTASWLVLRVCRPFPTWRPRFKRSHFTVNRAWSTFLKASLARNKQCSSGMLSYNWPALPSLTVCAEFHDYCVWTDQICINLRSSHDDTNSHTAAGSSLPLSPSPPLCVLTLRCSVSWFLYRKKGLRWSDPGNSSSTSDPASKKHLTYFSTKYVVQLWY